MNKKEEEAIYCSFYWCRAGELSGIEETITTNINIWWRRNYIEDSPSFPETEDAASDPHFHRTNAHDAILARRVNELTPMGLPGELYILWCSPCGSSVI